MRVLLISTVLVTPAFFMGPAIAQQQLTGTAQFCIKGPTGPIKCEYQTMAQCQEARPQGPSDQCVPRAEAEGTIGGPPQRERPSAPGEQKD
jgi:hypothetical protein